MDTRNKPPEFADQDSETDGIQNETATRKVQENTEALADDDAADDATDANTDDNVGNPLTATDPDPNMDVGLLIYTLSAADAGSFRVRNNGQIEVAAGTKLDLRDQAKNVYMVTLTAEDSFGASASIMVTITVTDMDEDPEITLGGLAITGTTSVSYAEDRRDAVATYSATGPESANAMWSLEGDDAGALRASAVVAILTFKSAPDYEMPMDMSGDNMYMVTVMADDGTYMDAHDVTVMVTDVDEMETVTLSAMRPQVGTAITAELIDDGDEISGAVTWQWASSNAREGTYTDIEDDATSASYTPVDGDENMYLRATAMYADAHGSDKSASERSASTVGGGLAISGPDQRGATPRTARTPWQRTWPPGRMSSNGYLVA